MSSTMMTSRPCRSVSRSLRIRTTPDDFVPEPYDETAIQSARLHLEVPREVRHDHDGALQHADEQRLPA